MKRKFSWDFASFVFILFYLVLAFWRSSVFPVHLDIYYHLGVMQGFDLAKGIVSWDFWEFAPLGRPHFYPPLLHILMLLLYKAGFSKIQIAFFSSFITFPLFVISFWFITKKIFNSRLAFFVVLMALVSYNLFIGLTNTLAATLAIVILFGLFYSLEKNKRIASIILTALLFYTHYAISVMGILSLAIYFILRRENIKEKFLLLSAGIVLALPWFIHFISNLGYLRQIIYYDLAVEINAILLILALPGIFFCLKSGKEHLFFIILILVALLGTLGHPYRFFSTQGAVGMILASAVVLEKLFSWFDSRKILHAVTLVFVFVFVFNLFSFSVILSPLNKKKFVQDSLIWNLSLYPFQARALHSFRDICFYRHYGDEFKKILDIVNNYTDRGDIIYSNYGYQAGILSAFTERANATMSPYTLDNGVPQEKYIRNARLIVWLKNPDGKMENELLRYINMLKLEKVAETPTFFYVYRNPAVNFKMKIAHPVLPAGLAFLLLFSSIGLVIWDWVKGV